MSFDIKNIYSPDPLKNPLIGNFENYKQKYKESLENNFWFKESKKLLDFDQKPLKGLEGEFGNITFCEDGFLNASYNCIDRHLPEHSNDIAIIYEADISTNSIVMTYKELSIRVNKTANLLKKYVTKGDIVGIYMSTSPDLVVTMLACARIGCPHSIIFAGFSSEAVRQRLIDAKCKLVITQKESFRRGKQIQLSEVVNKAVEDLVDTNVLIFGLGMEEKVENESEICIPESLPSEHPLFVLYTSGSTGKPKGLVHSTAGYLTYVAATHKYVFDVHKGDIFGCMADIGWITGHSYIVYGPLINGTTTLLFGSTPDYPDIGRYWKTVEKWGITHFYTAPTAIRFLMQYEFENKYDLSSLRVLGSVGEPINPEAWSWYFENVGKNKCWLVDTYWQTETGGITLTPMAGITPMKRGSATLPFFGIVPVLLDSFGNEIKGNSNSGLLAFKKPWPGIARTILGDHDRYLRTYIQDKYYITGDAAYRDLDGYIFIKGRVDDVLNVSGHRLGTSEIESALTSSSLCVEAAVVSFPHKIKGEGIFCFCVLSSDSLETHEEEEITFKLRSQVINQISKIAIPDKIVYVEGLPKTRSGKIMRRVLRNIAKEQYEGFGDLSTIKDPSIVNTIVRKTKRVLGTNCTVI